MNPAPRTTFSRIAFLPAAALPACLAVLAFLCGCCRAVAVPAAAPTAPISAPAAAGTGVVEGRVFNANSGATLRNARVSVDGTAFEAITDDYGAYRLQGVPGGTVRVSVHYLGFDRQSVAVLVPAGGVVQRDFDLRSGAAEGRSGAPELAADTITLEAFTVAENREMSAQSVALAERRFAPNVKNVVAFDEYGEMGDENIGEFMRFLPGVGVNDSGLTASSLTLRGFPSSNTGIQLDGSEVASRNNSRSQSLLDISVANIARVEVTKVPTPDMPASGLGGSINVISKSGFESRKPVFNYQVYTMLTSTGPISLMAGPPGLAPELSPKHQQPSFNVSYLLPVNRSLALSFGLTRSWRLKPMERDDISDTQSDWNLVNLFQRQSTWYSLCSLLSTWSGQLGADLRLSPRDTVSVSFQQRLVSNFIMRNDLVFAYGTGATGSRTHTQGAATGVGTVTQGSGTNRETATDTRHLTLRYKHLAEAWRIESSGYVSSNLSILDDIDDGHFDSAPSRIGSIVLRGEGIGEDDALIPVRYSAATRTGAPVDLFDGGNYSILSATSSQFRVTTRRIGGRLDFTREFSVSIPWSVKTGLFVDRQDKDQHTFNRTWSFNPNGLTTDAARQARNFDVFDPNYLPTAPKVFGNPMGWVSLSKLYDLYRAQPSWFVLDEAAAHQSAATNSRELREIISAAYLRADVRLFRSRLWLAGGIRFERTDDEGWGVLNDPAAQYQRDASGRIVLDSRNQPVLITTDALGRARLRYVERGSHAKRDYAGGYPSLNATYNITENLLVRAGVSRTIGRPDLGLIVPGVTFSEPTVSNPTITVNNTGLRPWRADGVDLSIESYQIKGGFGSVGVFQKNIRDFFGTVRTPATPEQLALYGLPDDPAYANYEISTRNNVGDAKVQGLEVSYTQSLTFLPHWARGLQIFANASKLHVEGSNDADFDGFAPSNFSGGINFSRSRLFLRLTCTHQGETRTGLNAVSTANGIPADTYSYQGARTRLGINVRFNLSKRLSLYGNMTDINGGMTTLTRRYAPDTPEYARNVRRQELGSAITFGVKGSF